MEQVTNGRIISTKHDETKFRFFSDDDFDVLNSVETLKPLGEHLPISIFLNNIEYTNRMGLDYISFQFIENEIDTTIISGLNHLRNNNLEKLIKILDLFKENGFIVLHDNEYNGIISWRKYTDISKSFEKYKNN